MKITSKNMIIMMILIFLIFNQFLGIAWELVKSFFYCILFMILIDFLVLAKSQKTWFIMVSLL